MALTNAQKQAKYRRRQAVRTASNGFIVTTFKAECERAGMSGVYDLALETALDVADQGGRGDILLNRLALLFYGTVTVAVACNKLATGGQLCLTKL